MYIKLIIKIKKSLQIQIQFYYRKFILTLTRLRYT